MINFPNTKQVKKVYTLPTISFNSLRLVVKFSLQLNDVQQKIDH